MKCYEGSETTKAFIEKDCGSGTACMKSHAGMYTFTFM